MTRLNSTYETAIITWIAGNITDITATKVVWDKQAAPRPALPYVTVNIMPPVDETGMIPESGYTATDVWTMTHRFRIGVSINIIANENYLAKMQQLIISLDKDSVRTALKAAGLYFRYAEDSVDLTELLDSGYEFRIQKDFVFGYVATTTEAINEIRRIILGIDMGEVEIAVDETVT